MAGMQGLDNTLDMARMGKPAGMFCLANRSWIGVVVGALFYWGPPLSYWFGLVALALLFGGG
jgi:hypothetical protein